MNTIKLAKKIATEAHKGQFRRDGKTPYIVHPQAVARQVGGIGEIVGWLHDVLENSDLTLHNLLDKGIPFDAVILVDILTKRKNESYLQYILRVKRDPTAIMIKITDMYDNAKTATESQKTKYLLAKYILEH